MARCRRADELEFLAMQSSCFLVLLLAASQVQAWAPFDRVSSYFFGTAPLQAAVAAAARPYPLDDVAHEQCHVALGGCMPADGCALRMGRCEAKVGHYWPVGEAEELPSLLRPFVPPIAPPYHMMTEKGIMEGRPNFWYTTYRMLASVSPSRPIELHTTARAAYPAWLPNLGRCARLPRLACVLQGGTDEAAPATLPGVHEASYVAYYLCLPGTILFLLYVLLAGA